jgi:Tol biopolymer transport system component
MTNDIAAGARRLSTAGLVAALVWAAPGIARAEPASPQLTKITIGVDGSPASRESKGASVSADGRYVAFVSAADNLVDGDTNHADDVFVTDRISGTTTRVSVASDGAQANGPSAMARISGNGHSVFFTSEATNLAWDDRGASRNDIYLHDLDSGATERVTANLGQPEPYDWYGPVAVSADGRYVAYAAQFPFEWPRSRQDVLLRDLVTGETTRVNTGLGGAEPDGSGDFTVAISANGQVVVFESDASNLVPGDTNQARDSFAFDHSRRTLTRVSVADDGTQARVGFAPAISGDGHYVAFVSFADLLLGNTKRSWMHDVYIRDLWQGGTVRASVSADGKQANNDAENPALNNDGSVLAYTSNATNLVAGGPAGDNIFRFDRTAGTVQQLSAPTADLTPEWADRASISADGRTVAFDADPNRSEGRHDVYVWRQP